MTTTNVAIVQGYSAQFTVNLFNADGTPKDLTGCTQILAVFPAHITGLAGIQQSKVAALTTTGNLANGSNQLTNLASVAGIEPGQLITGTGVPASTYVVSLSGSTATMSQNATGAGTGVSVVFGNTNVSVVSPAGSGEIQVTVPAGDSANFAASDVAQALQISVTDSGGTKEAFILPGFLSISTPPYGQL